MKHVVVILTIVIMAITFAGCAGTGVDESKNMAPRDVGTVFMFSETPPGGKATPVSMFINDYFIRIDEAGTRGDYVLFDRKAQTIKNVVAETKTVFIIEKQNVIAKPPIEIDYTVEKQASSALMKKREGMKAFHYKHTANGKTCYSTVSVEKYMPQAVVALREFRSVLAGEHSKTMSNIPGEDYDACDLALNIFHADKHLDHGFPVREWDENGYQRFLVDARKNIQVQPELLTVPEDYRTYSINP